MNINSQDYRILIRKLDGDMIVSSLDVKDGSLSATWPTTIIIGRDGEMETFGF